MSLWGTQAGRCQLAFVLVTGLYLVVLVDAARVVDRAVQAELVVDGGDATSVDEGMDAGEGADTTLVLDRAEKPKTVIIIGATGTGKSTLGNFLAGQYGVFEASGSLESVTKEAKAVLKPFFNNGDEYGMGMFVDTPGLGDTKGKGEDKQNWDKVIQVLKNKVQKADAIVLLLKGTDRATSEMKTAITQFRETFGKKMWGVFRVIVNYAPWDLNVQKEKAAERRQLLLDIEEQVSSPVPEDVKADIQNLPVYAVNLNPDVLDDTLRYNKFEIMDCEDTLADITFAECIALDAKLQDKYEEYNFPSYTKELKKRKLIGEDEACWGKSFSDLNLGRLEEFRQDLMQVKRPLVLKDMGGFAGEEENIKVTVPVTAPGGVKLGATYFLLSRESTVEDLVDKAVFTIPVIRELVKKKKPKKAARLVKGWLQSEVTFEDAAGMTLSTNDTLSKHAEEILAKKQEGNPKISAKVVWALESPPNKLDPALVQACVDSDSIGAMATLLADGITSADQLAFMSPAKLETNLHNTKQHGRLMEELKTLRKAKNEETQKNDEAINSQDVEAQREKIKKIKTMREQLEPYVMEAQSEAEARGNEAGKASAKALDKVNKMLNDVRKENLMSLPDKMPWISTNAELAAFLRRLDEKLQTNGKQIAKAPLTSMELIWNSDILSGIYVSGSPEVKSAAEMIQVRRFPDLSHVLTSSGAAVKDVDATYMSQASSTIGKTNLEKVGSSWATSDSASGGGFVGNGVAAFSVAVQIDSASKDRDEQKRTKMLEEQQHYKRIAYYLPQKKLQLTDDLLRFTPGLLERVANILQEPESRWSSKIKKLFDLYGTHYCPVVQLGGVWLLESSYTVKKDYDKAQVDNAMSHCLNSEVKGGAGYWGMGGYGKASVGVSTDSCREKSDKYDDASKESMMNARTTHTCISDLGYCPTSYMDFVDAMRTSANWQVLDRVKGNCQAMWDSLTEAPHRGDLIKRLPEGLDGETLIDKFESVAKEVWLMEVLDLKALCKKWKPRDVKQCLEDKDIYGIWTYLKTKWDMEDKVAQELAEAAAAEAAAKAKREFQMKRNKACAAKQYCGELHGGGRCDFVRLGTGDDDYGARCHCKPEWNPDTNCHEKFKEQDCQDWQQNPCTAHPLPFFQPKCHDAWGQDYKRETWKSCNILSGRWICLKEYKCRPKKKGENCC